MQKKTNKFVFKTRKIDSNKIKNQLGWEAKTSLEDGLLLAYNWYNENKTEFN